MKEIEAWYFSTTEKKLRYDDGRQIQPGQTHKIEGKPEVCVNGLHASKRIIDALHYAPGPYVWRVKLGGLIETRDDKMAATERTYLWGYDASGVLRTFARKCALDVVHLWDAPEIVVRYLKTGDESIRAAAWAAARDAARAAAWDAAWDAARAAAGDAARAAAGDAAMAAAWDAAWDAARAAAWDAARAAAWDAAGYAAWEKQNRRLLAMIRHNPSANGDAA